ncbi:uncharacterized protein LOC117338268 isoform X1 [Pecten maximus]|uniref:uncharacterized protein LOC117338268 isoform X1 n=1 Tax=Pecten maximus TaxID=6579 RepID=UPI0014586A26|nr:uncharacterized protein LOC117338268 isoform X1 [Pecten maximus]
MLSAPGPRPHVLFGQGKSANTLLTEDGCHYPVISPAYTDRMRAASAPYEYGKGVRAMHKTTLTIAKPPWDSRDAYKTSNKQYFGGSKSLNPVRRPPRCPSMHTSQWDIGQNQQDKYWDTHYKGTFHEKEIIPATARANRLHMTSLVNRIDQTEGADMKQTIKSDKNHPNYWSQYGRIHNKLGHMLGTGVSREPPVRKSYNVITGEELGPAWEDVNRRVSGNRVLYSNRCERAPLLLG